MCRASVSNGVLRMTIILAPSGQWVNRDKWLLGASKGPVREQLRSMIVGPLDDETLGIPRQRDESLEDTDNLPAPEVIAAEIVEDLQAALDQFSEIAETLSTVQ